MYICVTCKITGSKSKWLRRMTREAAFRTVLPVKKRHKEAFEAPCVCFNVLPKAFRRYSEKVTFWPSVTLYAMYMSRKTLIVKVTSWYVKNKLLKNFIRETFIWILSCCRQHFNASFNGFLY